MSAFMHAMLGGMLILIVPAFLICTGIAVMAYRKRNSYVTPRRPPPGPVSVRPTHPGPKDPRPGAGLIPAGR